MIVVTVLLVAVIATSGSAGASMAASSSTRRSTDSLVAPRAPVGAVTNFYSTSEAKPWDITAGPDGNLWFVNLGQNSIGRLTPAGVLTTFTDPTISYPWDITAGPDGALWFTNSLDNSIGRITTSGVVSNYEGTGIDMPEGITAGPDGALWFTNAANSSIGRITTSGVVSNFTGSGIYSPQRIVSGPDGNLWFINSSPYTSYGFSIGRITTSGTVTDFAGGSFSDATDIAVGADGSLWITNSKAATTSGVSAIDRLTPAGVLSSFTEPGLYDPTSLVAGPDGQLWFAIGDGGVGEISTAGVFSASTFAVWGHRANSGTAHGMTRGPDGNVWLTEQAQIAQGDSWVAELAPDGADTTFDDPGTGNGLSPGGVAKGPDGDIWFAAANAIGRINDHGVTAYYSDPGMTLYPGLLTAGPDGDMYFTDSYDHIGKVTPTGAITLYPVPTLDDITGLTDGPDGATWFTKATARLIFRLTPDGTLTSFPTGSSSSPTSIVSGPDGALWFTSGSSIGRMTTSGAVSWFTDSTVQSPVDITSGPDGNLWFTNNDGIGRITPAGILTAFTDPSIAVPQEIVAGPDGNLWFSNPLDQTIQAITTTGVVTSFGARNEPGHIAFDGRGNLWFGQSSSGGMGRLQLAGLPGAPAQPVATPGRAAATVSWQSPTFDGETPITGYTVTAAPGGQTCSWTAGPLVCTLTGLTPNATYTFAVTATNEYGTGSPSISSNALTLPPADGFVPVAPVRVLDSRSDSQVGPFGSPWDAGVSRDVAVAGVGGVPANADAVVLNVTVTDTSDSSFLSVWPTGGSRPLVSSLNWTAGETIANAVTAPVGAAGQVSIYNRRGQVDVIIDVAGYYVSS